MAVHEEAPNPRGRESLRAADDDRQRVADHLYGALNEGRLDLGEYDERVRAVYAARTYAELDALLGDLPAARTGTVAVPHRKPPTPQSPTGRPARRIPLALMILWTIWGGLVAVNVVVWFLVALTVGHHVYPWPVWVALPPGAALLATTVGVQAIRHSRR